MPGIRRRGLQCAWLPLCVAACQAPATGGIGGSVASAPASAQVASGTVTARNAESGEVRSAAVRRDGSFLLIDLPPGDYLLDALLPGGKMDLGPAITVVPGQTVDLNAVRAPLTDPAVQLPGGEPDEDGDGLASARGLPPTLNGASLDGLQATQTFGSVPVGSGAETSGDPDDDPDAADSTTGPSHGLGRGRHAGVAYTYAAGSVREFRVGTDAYSAQAGSAGGVLTATTRGGGDKLRGSASFRLRSSELAARSPLAIATSYADGAVTAGEVKPHDLEENAALTLGGKVPRTRALHYFCAGDMQRRGFPAISSPADADFYHLTAIQTDLLATRGVTARQTVAGLNFLSSLTGETPRRADQQIQFGRMDWLARPRLGFGVEYNGVRWNSPAGLLDAPVVARGRASLGNAAGSVDQALARVSPRWSAGTGMEVRLGWTRDLQYERPQQPLAQEAAIGPAGTSPEVNIGPNGLLFGTPASLSQVAYPDEQRLEVGDVVTLTRGRNLVQFGGTFGYVAERVATQGNAAGTFRYDSGTTGGKAGGLVDFLTDFTYGSQSHPSGACPKLTQANHLDCFRTFSQSFGETQVAFSTQDWAGFVEDTWRPRTGLTLHAGLRYEYTLLPLPQQPNAALDAVFGTRGATGVFPEDRNNLGPRLSAAFEPLGRGRLLVKLGYGAYFGRVPGATIQAALSETGQDASTVTVRIRPADVATCPQLPSAPFGYLCSFTGIPTGTIAATTSAMVFDRHFRLPVVQQASLEVEREIRRGTTVSVQYVHNTDRQLPSSTDLNIAPATGTKRFQLQGGTGAIGVRDGETFVVPVYTQRLTPNFGPVTDIESNANAYYDGLVVRVATHPVRSLTVVGRYTWSKAIDFGPSGSATPKTDGQFDPFTDGYDKGLSSLNYPQALHATATWAPGGEGSKRRHAVSHGWTASAITTTRSGRPYTLDLSGGTYLPGGHESLNGSGGAQYLPTVGRNTLRLPMTLKTDVRLGRAFPAWRGVKGLATVEAFNIFNHENVSSVNHRAYLVGAASGGVTPLVFQSAAEIATEGLNTTAFGTPTGTGTSLNRERQVQLSLRLDF